MYAGRRAAIEFNAQIMPADSWEAELSVESIPLTTIKVLREVNVDGDIKDVKPDWVDHGVPVRKIHGGMREVKGKMHGFWRTNASVPSIGDTISVALTLDNVTFFVINQCLVSDMKISVKSKEVLEWEMEWEAISDGDFTGRF